MANGHELKLICKARIKSAIVLMNAHDWQGSGYIMGNALECILKSVICKTLHLEKYPDHPKDDAWFLTHSFDRLLRLSGLGHIFGPRGIGFQVWSDFTKYYQGDWISMRYDMARLNTFNETNVPQLLDSLICKKPGKYGIMTIINRQKKC
ncbi:MAG: hypothetical protein NTW66_04525 [Candidatus Magasanikbacteria bacterium]|nr:hypothetical protein [Candidatus Magasanikbacteria bacterium]